MCICTGVQLCIEVCVHFMLELVRNVDCQPHLIFVIDDFALDGVYIMLLYLSLLLLTCTHTHTHMQTQVVG